MRGLSLFHGQDSISTEAFEPKSPGYSHSYPADQLSRGTSLPHPQEALEAHFGISIIPADGYKTVLEELHQNHKIQRLHFGIPRNDVRVFAL